MSQDYKGTITLASVSDGTPGIAIPYVISSNTENIHKHYNTGDGTLQFYSNLEFWVNKVENQQSTLLDPNIDYDSAIEVVGSPQFGNLWGLFNRLTYSDISTDPPTQYNILEYIREVKRKNVRIINGLYQDPCCYSFDTDGALRHICCIYFCAFCSFAG